MRGVLTVPEPVQKTIEIVVLVCWQTTAVVNRVEFAQIVLRCVISFCGDELACFSGQVYNNVAVGVVVHNSIRSDDAISFK